jgi:hypothetical protein
LRILNFALMCGYDSRMNTKQVRDVIQGALLDLTDKEVRTVPVGNTLHLYVDDDEFEIVIKTVKSGGSQRLAIKLD